MKSITALITITIALVSHALAVTIDNSATKYFNDWKCHNEKKAHGLKDIEIITKDKSELAIPGATKDGKDMYSYTGKIPNTGPPGGIPYDQVTVLFNYYPFEPRTVGLVSVSWPFGKCERADPSPIA